MLLIVTYRILSRDKNFWKKEVFRKKLGFLFGKLRKFGLSNNNTWFSKNKLKLNFLKSKYICFYLQKCSILNTMNSLIVHSLKYVSVSSNTCGFRMC